MEIQYFTKRREVCNATKYINYAYYADKYKKKLITTIPNNKFVRLSINFE